MMARFALVLMTLLIASCGGLGRQASVDMPHFESTIRGQALAEDYRIGALDVLNVNVFQAEDLSFEEITVNAAGNLQLPVVGMVRAQGLTTEELSAEIQSRLARSYLRNPQVSISVKEAASQKVTVDGAVTEPGVFEMRGQTSLLQAIAMAKGAQRTAALDRVVVFRTIDGQRMAARYDVREIRSGRMADPLLRGEDIVVVDGSLTTALIRDVVALLPTLAIFAAY